MIPNAFGIILLNLYIAFSLSLFFVREFPYHAGVAAMVAFLLLFLPARAVRSGSIPILFFLLFTFCGNLFFHPGKVLYGSGLFSITEEGLFASGVRTLRVFSMIYGAKIVTSLLSLDGVISSLEKMLNPLEKIGIPVKEFFNLMGLTLKSFPVLTSHLSTAYRKEKVENRIEGFRNRLRHMVSFMVPVFVESICSPERFFVAEDDRILATEDTEVTEKSGKN